MSKHRDRHLEAPAEVNRDKHINFLAEERRDEDPASEDFGENDKEVDKDDTAARNSVAGVEDGLIPEDDNRFQAPAERKHDSSSSAAPTEKKTIPLDADEKEMLAEKISINKNNDDIVAGVTDQQSFGQTDEDDEAH
jgi:hypothetical protein